MRWRRLDSVSVTSLAKRRAAGEQITPHFIAQEAEHGDEVARQVIMETAYWLAIGIVSLIHTIDPDAVVLGGAMTFGGKDSPRGPRISPDEFATRSGRDCSNRSATPCESSSPRSAATRATSARPGWRGWNIARCDRGDRIGKTRTVARATS